MKPPYPSPNGNHEVVELLVGLRTILTDTASDNSQGLFQARETLKAVVTRLEHGPYGHLVQLCEVTQMMLGQLLRRGSLQEAEGMHMAASIVEFLTTAAALPAPPLPHSISGTAAAPPAPVRMASDSPAPPAPMPQAQASPRPAGLANHPKVTPTDTGLSGVPGAPLPADGAPGGAGVSLQQVNESRLGEILIKMGKIDREQLDKALMLQKLSRKRLGEILISMEALAIEDLKQAFELQRQETLRLAGGLGASGAEPGHLRLSGSPPFPGV